MTEAPNPTTDPLDIVKEFAKQHILLRRRELIVATEFPADLWQAFADSGLAGLSIPEQYGGQGASYQTLSKAARCLNFLAVSPASP